jgi:hypothetical protein
MQPPGGGGYSILEVGFSIPWWDLGFLSGFFHSWCPLATEQESNEKKVVSMHHPSIHGGAFMHTGSLWTILQIMKTIM